MLALVMSSYLLAHGGTTIVTDADGTISVVPGLPIVTTTPAQAALLAGLFDDGDLFFAPAVAAPGAAQTLIANRVDDGDVIKVQAVTPGSVTLIPTLVADADSIIAADADLVSPPGKTQRLKHQAGRVTDSDTIYSPARLTARLLPGLIPADDAIANAIVDTRNTLRPALVASDDAIAANAVTTTAYMLPNIVSDADAIPAADVGWHLFADAPVIDADTFHGVLRIDQTVPLDAFFDEESVSGYPFRVQSVTGGIPVPDKVHLTGTLGSYPRRALHGSMRSSVRLTGSLTNMKRRRRR